MLQISSVMAWASSRAVNQPGDSPILNSFAPTPQALTMADNEGKKRWDDLSSIILTAKRSEV